MLFLSSTHVFVWGIVISMYSKTYFKFNIYQYFQEFYSSAYILMCSKYVQCISFPLFSHHPSHLYKKKCRKKCRWFECYWFVFCVFTLHFFVFFFCVRLQCVDIDMCNCVVVNKFSKWSQIYAEFFLVLEELHVHNNVGFSLIFNSFCSCWLKIKKKNKKVKNKCFTPNQRRFAKLCFIDFR